MKKVKKTQKHLEKSAKYQLSGTRTKDKKIDKSFWQKLSKKAKITLACAIAIGTIAGFAEIYEANHYPDISAYNITTENLDDKNTLDYWINNYNHAGNIGEKRAATLQIADYSSEVENIALNDVKEIIVEQIKENPRDKSFLYNEIEDPSDIKIHCSDSDKIITVKDIHDIDLDIKLSDEMEDVIYSVADLQTAKKSGDKLDIGKRALKVLAETAELDEHEFTAKNKNKGILNKDIVLEIDEI
ncbi:MAG: hypothetical protein E7311_00220 [Clostridiales bacterium]|nr:hypothetical protein [Clostridiales bacterium]